MAQDSRVWETMGSRFRDYEKLPSFQNARTESFNFFTSYRTLKRGAEGRHNKETELVSARREDFIASDGAFQRLFDVLQSAIRNAQLKRTIGIAETENQ